MHAGPKRQRHRAAAWILAALAFLIMALSHRATTTASANAAQGVVINKPAGTVAGDAMVCAIAIRGGTNVVVISPPTGWAQVPSARANDGTNVTLAAFIKYATSSEPANYTFWWAPQADVCVVMSSYGAAEFGRLALRNIATAASGTSHPVPSNATSHAGNTGGFGLAFVAAGAANTWTEPSGQSYTEIADIQSSAVPASAVSLAAAHRSAGGQGEMTPGSWTSSSSVSSASVAVALFPAGLTQPTGTGGNVRFQDDLFAVNGQNYNEAEMALGFPADIVDEGLNSYKFNVSVQNGDGVGTAKTTWKTLWSKFRWATGKTYIISGVGRVNRYTEWGLAVVGADGEPIGYDGAQADVGLGTTFQGNFKLYGCEIRGLTGTTVINFLPGEAGTYSELVDTDVRSSGTQQYGNTVKAIDRIRRLTAVGVGSGTNGRIVNFQCVDSDVLALSFPNGQHKMNTASQVILRRPRFIGASTSADVNFSFGGQVLEPTWSKNCVKSTIHTLEEWEPFGVTVGAAGVPKAGALVELIDPVTNRTVVSAVTDALGRITFTSASSPWAFNVPFATNAVLVRGPDGLGATREYGPFTLRVTLTGYPVHTQVFPWTHTTFLGTEKQYEPMHLAVDLETPAPTTDVPYFQEGDIAILIADSGQDVTIGGNSTKGYVERVTRKILEGEASGALATDVFIFIKTGSLPGLASGVLLSADGSTFSVREFGPIGDGALTQILCANA